MPLVVWRTRSGQLQAADARCPHLGADLSAGGMVIGEQLRCPLHHWRFDTAGRCVTNPAGTIPRRSSLRTVPIIEQDGLILVYRSAPGTPPSWRPRPVADGGAWSRWRCHQWTIPADLRVVAEHPVDFAHLQALHALDDVRMDEPIRYSGPRMHSAYRARQAAPRPFPRRITLADTAFTLTADGPGVTSGTITVTAWPGWSTTTRLLLCVTPTTAGQLTIRIASSIGTPLGRRMPGVFTPLLRLVTSPVAVLAAAIFKAEVAREVQIWRHQHYLEQPALADAEGVIRRHRRWLEQFRPAGSLADRVADYLAGGPVGEPVGDEPGRAPA
jgi:nitrite reductase/ring-hydroxylating ferredoxin subunit